MMTMRVTMVMTTEKKNRVNVVVFIKLLVTSRVSSSPTLKFNPRFLVTGNILGFLKLGLV